MADTGKHPFHPIIYIRGFAATQSEIEDTVADPYMGLNIGSTKARRLWTGDVHRIYFESPLVRFMRQYGYLDIYSEGRDLLRMGDTDGRIQYRSVVIHRYYDEASEDFGSGDTPPIERFSAGLSELIHNLRKRICSIPDNGVSEGDFRVYLVAHSMGGLVARAFLQNPELDPRNVAGCVDKVFTYATPHNGIDLRVVRNIPGWLSFGDVDNFNRERMAKYLGLGKKAKNVAEVVNVPADRILNLVGTNSRDYLVAQGLSSWAVGENSDGLVRIENAITHGKDSKGAAVSSPRAFVHRSHSGHYGIVNSEEGYQNLTRFLFGDLRVDGLLDVDEVTLPVEVQREKDAGKNVRASYQFESSVSIRGCHWQFTRRSVRENSEIFRTFDQLFPPPAAGGQGARKPNRDHSPHLFSVFLDSRKSVKQSGSVSFAVDLVLLVPDYEINGVLFLKRHYEGGYILREQLLIEVFRDTGTKSGFRIKYGLQSTNPGKPGSDLELTPSADRDVLEASIPVANKARPGFTGELRLQVRNWR